MALNWHSCTASARFKEAVSGVCKVGALGYIRLFSQLHFIVPAGGFPQDAWTSIVKNAFTCLSGGGLLEVSRSPTGTKTIWTFLCYFMLASHLITEKKLSEVGIQISFDGVVVVQRESFLSLLSIQMCSILLQVLV